jgi:hypothetical protein
MAQHRSGNAVEATNLLHEARSRLENLIRAGDLGHTTFYPADEWLPAAQFVLACREAEGLLHGQRIWPPIDDAYLAAARQRWQPIKVLLDEVNTFGGQRNWPAAYERLMAAVRDEYFDWSAAIHSREAFALKAAVTMLLGGDLAAYDELRLRLMRHDYRPNQISPCSVLLRKEALPSGAAREALLNAARSAAQDAKPSHAGYPWRFLELGLAEYRAGNPQDALSALEPAEQAYNLNCSAIAHAIGALALWELGQQEAARERLASAESAFTELLEGNRESAGRWWHGMAMLELLLDEARRVLGQEH